MCELKPYYSAQELIGLQLVILPTTKKAVIDKAKRENWQSRKRVGRGGGVEYALSSLPQEVQEEIRDKFATSVV
ncbi:DNA-binding protein, partial [Histophilus somni]